MFTQQEQDNYLCHYGILGMKWGVRKKRSTLGNNRYTRAARAASKDAADLRAHGYIAEAKAVQKVADRNAAKATVKKIKKSTDKEIINISKSEYKNLKNNRDLIKKYRGKTIKIDGDVWHIS